MKTPFHVPSIYIQSRGEKSTHVVLQLTRAASRYVIRLTGGCGDMSPEDGTNLIDLFADAFQGGFKGALLFGGTRMLHREDPQIVLPSITEIAPIICQQSPESVSLGVVPKTSVMRLTEYGMLVSEETGKGFFTVIHPQQNSCLVVQPSADELASWETEYEECATIIEHLRQFAGWQSLLMCYNGGGVTEKELLFHANQGWPVLLIAGSGRITDRYAADDTFLNSFPNVHVVKKDSQLIREELLHCGALEEGGNQKPTF